MKQQKKNNKTYRLVVTAMMIALATLLNEVAVFESPFLFGGGVTVFSQVPIIVLSYVFGPAWGLLSGFTMSVIQLIFGLSNLSYVKGIMSYLIVILFDYIIPYTVLGLAGVFKGKFGNKYIDIGIGTIMVCALRFLCHFISGATVWADWTSGQDAGAILTYAALYNLGYMAPETLISLIGVFALATFLFPMLGEDGMIKNKG